MDVSFPLAEYSAQHWITHAHCGTKAESQSSSVFALTMKLLTGENTAFVNWVRLCDIDQFYLLNLQKERVDIATPLYYASVAGLTEATHALLEMQACINAQGGRYRNALQAAASEGHFAIAKLLIEKGADVNAQGGVYGNALQAASYQGHEKIVKVLIENGANVNAHGGHYGNSLCAATYQGHEAIVKQLMEKDTHINTVARSDAHKASDKILSSRPWNGEDFLDDQDDNEEGILHV